MYSLRYTKHNYTLPLISSMPHGSPNSEISMPMNLQTAANILEMALRSPTSSAVNAVKAGIGAIENLAKELPNARLRLLLAKVHGLGLPGRPAYERAYAYVLAAWAAESEGYEAQFALAEEQQYWEVTLTPEQQARAAELVPHLLADGECPAHSQGNPFNPSWWGWEDDPIPERPGNAGFRLAYDKWRTTMRIE